VKNMTILDTVLRRVRVVVKENERILAFHKGELIGLYGPGEHALPNRGGSGEVARLDVSAGSFASVYEKVLFDKLPDEAKRHLTVFRTDRNQVALIERDGQVWTVIGPDRKLVVWNDAGPWAVSHHDVDADLRVDQALLRRLVAAGKGKLVHTTVVPDGHVGLLFVDGVYREALQAGLHGFWEAGRAVSVKQVDLRRQAVDVSGQEMLTRDRVTIRVNLTAGYRVVDPMKAVTKVKDFMDELYRALQLAYRKAIGQLSLDQILEKKVQVDEDALKAEMAALGVEVSDISLKDVILPGEMRDILNQVVTAEKQAEANVIRRREETNATRSLLNTAKVMAENPVMLRLKELEALEAIAGKVERLTVHNGTGGLLNDLVKLRD